MDDQQRQGWDTITLDNCITYNAFSLIDVMLGKDMQIFSKHLDVIERSALTTRHIDHMWPDVFVSPTTEDLLGMRLYDYYGLVRTVLIPHIYSVTLPGLSRRLRYNWDLMRKDLSSIDGKYPNAGQFLEAIQTLSETPGGEYIVSDLHKENVKNKFNDLLPCTFLKNDDYVTYLRDIPSRKKPVEENLLLPSWVRNRLAHPENRFERKYPTRSDIERATGLIYAVSLALRYKKSHESKIGNIEIIEN